MLVYIHDYEPSALRLSNHTKEGFFGFCLQVFRPAGPPQQVNCFVLMGNKRKVSFLGTQQRVASS